MFLSEDSILTDINHYHPIINFILKHNNTRAVVHNTNYRPHNYTNIDSN